MLKPFLIRKIYTQYYNFAAYDEIMKCRMFQHSASLQYLTEENDTTTIVRRNINTEIRCSLLLFSKMFNVDEWRGCVCCFCTTLYSQIFVFTTEFLGFSPCYFYLCFVYLLCVSSLFVWTQTQRIFWSNVDLPQFFDIFLSYIWIMYTLRKDWVQQERKGEN